MTFDKATKKLRALIERPEKCRFWGQPHTITPRLIAKVFGDGRQMVCVTPLATRPNYYVVRIDSSCARFFADIVLPESKRYLLDEIIEAAEEEYGYFGDEDERDESGDDPRPFPVTDWGIGLTWGESFPIGEWRPTPHPKRGRVQPQPRKGSIL